MPRKAYRAALSPHCEEALQLVACTTLQILDIPEQHNSFASLEVSNNRSASCTAQHKVPALHLQT